MCSIFTHFLSRLTVDNGKSVGKALFSFGNKLFKICKNFVSVLVYIFSNLAAFGVLGAIENNTGKVSMDDYNGLYKTNPRLSLAMMLAMFSLAGIPPSTNFFLMSSYRLKRGTSGS